MKYQDKKAQIRQEAIDYQASWESASFSYGDLAYFNNKFYRLGKRYGLLTEFRENGIC